MLQLNLLENVPCKIPKKAQKATRQLLSCSGNGTGSTRVTRCFRRCTVSDGFTTNESFWLPKSESRVRCGACSQKPLL